MPPSRTSPAASVLAAAKLVVPELLGKLVWRLVLVVAEAARPTKVAAKRAWECMVTLETIDRTLFT